MEIIKHKRYSNPNISFSNKHFKNCNFSQENPFTSLPNIINCKLETCNLVNCILDESNEIIDCNICHIKIEETDTQRIITTYNKDTQEQNNQIIEEK